VRGALWWSRQSHIVNYANHQHSPDGVTPIFQFLAPKKIIWGPSPHLGTTLETPLSPVSFGKSFMKIRSAVPENGCLIFCGERKKNKKTSVKHIHIRLIGGCVKQRRVPDDSTAIMWSWRTTSWPQNLTSPPLSQDAPTTSLAKNASNIDTGDIAET